MKPKPNGEIAKQKANSVTKGFLQRFGIDFHEVYRPIARLETIRIMVVILAYKGCKMNQLDANPIFLIESQEKEIYVK